MKKIVLLLTVAAFGITPVLALEPLILEPLGYQSNYGYSSVRQAADSEISSDVQMPAQTAHNYADSNMIPQNNAAKGLPVERKQLSRILIETKQGSRTNTQWNPGGKGTRSYF